ncbi:CDP-glycerol glycerophosphotransferase family protein [Candidatus Gracilibacteria bacterium]|nr:CDP-glycerol glycerophosphotransferase family protein [Candidatus Gracilibacteria bacterium]
MKKKIIAASSEYGSFNLLYPVFKECKRNYEIDYIGIVPENFNHSFFNKYYKITEQHKIYKKKYVLFLSGAGILNQLEREIRNKLELPEINFLDQLKNVKERYLPNNKNKMPDYICVSNREMKSLVSKCLEFDYRKIYAIGFPQLSEQKILKNKIQLKKKFKIDENIKIVTLCTEYIKKNNDYNKYGFDEIEIIELLKKYLSSFNFNTVLIIRIHPSDSKNIYSKIIDSEKIKILICEGDKEKYILQISDLVIGFSSIILIESVILGLTTVSYQKKIKYDFIEYPVNMRPKICHSINELYSEVEYSLNIDRKKTKPKTIKYNIKKVMELINEIV